jgi:hypothetical protein
MADITGCDLSTIIKRIVQHTNVYAHNLGCKLVVKTPFRGSHVNWSIASIKHWMAAVPTPGLVSVSTPSGSLTRFATDTATNPFARTVAHDAVIDFF